MSRLVDAEEGETSHLRERREVTSTAMQANSLSCQPAKVTPSQNVVLATFVRLTPRKSMGANEPATCRRSCPHRILRYPDERRQIAPGLLLVEVLISPRENK